MKRFLLLFLSAPTVLSVILPVVTAVAAEKQPATTDKRFCVNTHSKLICVKSAQLASNTPQRAMLIAKAEAEARDPDAFVNFSDEESDAAAAMFGCDCPDCIRSIRKLRMLAQIS
ncbi:hypothetical protein [Chamaesiphon polymorphus]|uniref:Uncharacterized protein n=1 Tax=Chamaesiphon polymorphus CCALA 037 TaxID=2107692 RepID=A0A2T1GMH2_9CYAN|nr:hypothetical protein [Chamaesiphon polymorphus]PSB59082.1 hypothetical protein C7B77_02385 [Chamaesiphon polymorphus CCALA 037]